MNCPLCKQHGSPFDGAEFFACDNCSGIYKNKNRYIHIEAEIERYKEHNNDVNDVRYQSFVSPISDHILKHFTPGQIGLDFGSGTAPVISKILQDHGYSVYQYDPIFFDESWLLNRKYDYIICCEVMEHFHNPDLEFALLHKMLKAQGALICMTHLYDEGIDFRNWYYRNDQTHVFIYRQETIKYIADNFGFADFRIEDRLIVLKA